MDVVNLTTGSTEPSQDIDKKSAITNKGTKNSKAPKKIFENNHGMLNNSFSKKPTTSLNNKPTESKKSIENYSTTNSVEEIQGQGNVCNQTSTDQTDIGNYSTSGVEENSVNGKDLESSTGLRDDRTVEILDFKLSSLETGREEELSIKMAAVKKTKGPESLSSHDKDNEAWNASAERPEQME